MLFSVIVPVYRVDKYLRKCVDSVLGQTCGDFELILVDDGSPDDCPAICDTYAAADSRVRVIHKANGGPASARKAALQVAKGAYVVYVDGDDWLTQDALECLRDAIERSRADVVLPAKRYEYADGARTVRECLAEGHYCGEALKELVYPLILMDQNMNHLGCQQIGLAIRRTLLYPCQMVVEDDLCFGEDLVCMLEIYRTMNSIYICDQAVYHYRIRDDSLSHRVNEDAYDQLLRLLRTLTQKTFMADGDFSERVDRYACFTCFVLMERIVRAKAFCQLGWVKRRMADPLIRGALLRTRFAKLKAKRRIALYLMRRDMLCATYLFLKIYDALKAPICFVMKRGRRQSEERAMRREAI